MEFPTGPSGSSASVGDVPMEANVEDRMFENMILPFNPDSEAPMSNVALDEVGCGV